MSLNLENLHMYLFIRSLFVNRYLGYRCDVSISVHIAVNRRQMLKVLWQGNLACKSGNVFRLRITTIISQRFPINIHSVCPFIRKPGGESGAPATAAE